MSRSTYVVKESFTGTGLLSSYTFNFKLEVVTHLLVVVLDDNGVEIERVRGNDTSFLNTVTFDPTEAGGVVLLNDPLPFGYQLLFLLANDTPTQTYEFRNKTSFNLEKLENALDWLNGQIQRLAFKAKAALKIHESDNEETFGTTLPPGISDQGGALLQISQDASKFQFGPKLPDISTHPGKVLIISNDGKGFSFQTLTSDSALGTSYKGFSGRFNQDWDTVGVQETLLEILDFSYAPPIVSLDCSASDDDVLREKGTLVTATTLSTSITKRSDNIASILYKLNGVLLQNYIGAFGSTVHTHNWTGSFSDNATFSVEVTDDGTSGGPTNVVASSGFSFVYPYFHGVGAIALSAASVAGLTKSIISSTASLLRVFTIAAGQVYYFAYPASYGVLTSIKDENNFETFPDWTLRVQNITGLDGIAVSYNIYEFKNAAGSPVTTNYTFIR